jgi:formate-dependent nitrite reductase membrane component NrfD
MSMGSWILLLWLILGVVLIVLWAQGLLESWGRRVGVLGAIARWTKPFTPLTHILIWPSFILAALLMIYTGVVLGTSNRALWSGSFLIPAIFVSSAVPTGIAAIILSLLVKPISDQEETVGRLGRVLSMVLVLQAVVLAVHLIWLGFFSTTAASDGVQRLVGGSLWFPFWGGAVVLGILIPLGLQAWLSSRRGAIWSYAVALSALCLLAGAFFLRASFLVGGQG